MIDFKGSHFERDVILWGVRWYVAYPMSYRQLEEMMEERGVEVDHSTLNRWVVKYAPLLEKQFRARMRARHALCSVHHLRELKALIDVEKEDLARQIRIPLSCASHATYLVSASRRARPRLIARIKPAA